MAKLPKAKNPEKPKPQKQSRTYYDYNECRDYLQEKYDYDERDYAGKYSHGNSGDGNKPYLDFWHWVIERYEIHNGCYITFDKSELDDIEKDWIKEIYSHYLDEFADDNGELEMYVWW